MKKWRPVQMQKDILRDCMLAILNRYARVILTICDFYLRYSLPSWLIPKRWDFFLLSPFYRCWTWSLKGLSNWLKVIWLVGDGTQIYTKGFWLQSSCSSILRPAITCYNQLMEKLQTVPTWGVVAGMSIWSQEEGVHRQYGRAFFKYWGRRSQWMEATGR